MLRTISAIAMAIQLSQPKVNTDDAQRFALALQEQAEVYDFDPLIGVSMIFHESSFNPRAVSANGEDWGLAQIRARHIGDCRKSRNPIRRPTPECQAQKERLLEPEENIRVMAELIAYHRNVCRQKVGNQGVPRWLASYQGRNSIKEDRWCTPGDGTHQVIRYRDRLVREVARHAKEIEAADQAATATAAAQAEGPGQVADSREPIPAEIVPPGRGG